MLPHGQVILTGLTLIPAASSFLQRRRHVVSYRPTIDVLETPPPPFSCSAVLLGGT